MTPHIRRSAMSVVFAVAVAVGATVMTTAASAAASTHPGGKARASAGGGWQSAQETPGTAALNLGGDASTTTVSCPSAGNCSAGGYYADSSTHLQVFVASQGRGHWWRAIEVPGAAALNAGGKALLSTISCGSSGNCAAGGSYTDGSGHVQAFLVSQAHNTWGDAVEVPGTAALNLGGNAASTTVSCASAGNCSVGGDYVDGSGLRQVFVISQVNGTWGNAVEVPGTAALNVGGNALLSSVSCATAGNCSGGGLYKDSSGHTQAFVVNEVHGVWGNAAEVPGSAALNLGGDAVIRSVSCASVGNCSAGGYYEDSASHVQAFAVSEVHGVWGNAAEVPGTAALNTGGDSGIGSVSCASAGNCSAGGLYKDSAGHQQAFVVNEVHGVWGNAAEVSGIANYGDAAVTSVSCTEPGDCSAGGTFEDSSSHYQSFVVDQVHGVWGAAIEGPGTLNQGAYGETDSVSCGAAGDCSAVGYYTDSSSHTQAFVADSWACWRTARR